MPRDQHGTYIDARELPKECRPPYAGHTVWEQRDYRGWHLLVRRLEGDPLPHVVASGLNPSTGKWEAHAERQEGATPASVRRWVDGLMAGEDQAAWPARRETCPQPIRHGQIQNVTAT